MNITFLGHAGLYIETEDCRVICDPWHFDNPVFFDSWYVYPDNSQLNWEKYLTSADYIYISHAHEDHLDRTLLKKLVSVNPDATIVLPDYRHNTLYLALRGLGFRKFVTGEVKVGKTSLVTYVSETVDREREDSELLVDDGNRTFLNVNDSTVLSEHKKDIFDRFGKVDLMACQFSGASFYPLSYGYEEEHMLTLCANHRKRAAERFLSVYKDVGASKAVLTAGPPCFLEEGMTHLNFFGDNASIFPDSWQVKEFDEDDTIYRILPGDSFTFESLVDRKEGPDKKKFISENLRTSEYNTPISNEEYSRAKISFLESSQRLMKASRWLYGKISEKVYLSVDGFETFRFCFKRGVIKQEPIDRSERYYVLNMPSRVFSELIEHESTDWEDALLSCRCRLERNPDRYNPFILGFFRNMSASRQYDIQYSSSQDIDLDEVLEVDGRKVKRYCPHQKFDLKYHGKVDLEANTITCLGHGWTWDLDTGEGVNVVCSLSCEE